MWYNKTKASRKREAKKYKRTSDKAAVLRIKVDRWKTYAMWSDSLGEYCNFKTSWTSVPEMNLPTYFISGFSVLDFFVMKKKFWMAWGKASDWRPVSRKNFEKNKI
jgi:hypothetical protein